MISVELNPLAESEMNLHSENACTFKSSVGLKLKNAFLAMNITHRYHE